MPSLSGWVALVPSRSHLSGPCALYFTWVTFVRSLSRLGGLRATTALLAAGAPETTVKQADRWLSSDMPQLYAHASTSSVQSFSDKMLTTRLLQADSKHHIFEWF